MKTKATRLLAMAILVSAPSTTASAAVMAVENFDYPNGNLAGDGGGSGWGAAWTNVSGPQATVSSGAATFTYNCTGSYVGSETARVLPALVGAGTTTWLRISARMSSNGWNDNSFGGLSLYEGNTERMLVGKGWPGREVWTLGARNLSSARTDYVSTVSLTAGMVDVWMKIVNGAADNDDTISLWLNPADSSSESALGTPLSTMTGRHLNFNTVRLRGGSSANGHSETWTYDNLAIASDFASVPEPASCLLGALALLGISLGRRRA